VARLGRDAGPSNRIHHLAASSLPERLHALPFAALRTGHRLLDRSAVALRRLARRSFIDMAARSLVRAGRATPQLSSPTALGRCQIRMLDRLDAVRRHPRRPA
jgi:hypothetical protein